MPREQRFEVLHLSLDSEAGFREKDSMAAKDYPLASAATAADSISTSNHVWVFDLGKASLGSYPNAE